MYAIPTPAIAGRLIGSVYVGLMKCNVFWNEEDKLVVYNMNRKWFASPDENTMGAIKRMINNNNYALNIDTFHLYEHGKDVTTREDFNNFSECLWSDYACDNLCVHAQFRLEPSATPVGGG